MHIFFAKPEEKRPLGKYWSRRKEKIKMDC
jgi:hypothetical protein